MRELATGTSLPYPLRHPRASERATRARSCGRPGPACDQYRDRAPALVPSTSSRAERVGTWLAAATRTVRAAQQPLPFATTKRTSTETDTLAQLRPTTRAACREEARPCPWVGCRHHLLLDMTETGALVINRPDGARRSALDGHTPDALVRVWIDEAIEHLARMEYTCALDVLDDNPEGIGPNRLARLLGMAKQSADYLTGEARTAMRRAGVALGEGAAD